METLYKVLKNNESCNGGNFNWTNYLPKQKGDKFIPGEWTPEISMTDINICNYGYHLTTKPINCLISSNSIYEAEAKQVINKKEDKVVCNSVRLLRKVTFNTGLNNTGEYNSGNSNSGYRNSGDSNSGYRNSGDSNSGDSNSGDRNSGDSNSGYWNSGDSNSGDSNSCNSNSGDRNSGNRNSGDSNSGNSNSGDRNSGDRNSGNWNSGNWNLSDFNSGAFNTEEHEVNLFNKKISLSLYKTIAFPNYFYFDLTEWYFYSKEKMKNDSNKQLTQGCLKVISYKLAWKRSFEKATTEEVKATIKLPNFDYKVFEDITGITKKMIDDKLRI
jgi:hypothetical protein